MGPRVTVSWASFIPKSQLGAPFNSRRGLRHVTDRRRLFTLSILIRCLRTRLICIRHSSDLDYFQIQHLADALMTHMAESTTRQLSNVENSIPIHSFCSIPQTRQITSIWTAFYSKWTLSPYKNKKKKQCWDPPFLYPTYTVRWWNLW